MISIEIVLYTAIGFCFLMLLRELKVVRKELNTHKRYIKYINYVENKNLNGNRTIKG